MPKHIAIIMDGNRRWAKEKGLATGLGHKKGAEVLENTARYCNKIGLKYLTVYAFSTENWKRSKEEVHGIMVLLEKYLDHFLKSADLDNIKLKIIGNWDSQEVPDKLRKRCMICKKLQKITLDLL